MIDEHPIIFVLIVVLIIFALTMGLCGFDYLLAVIIRQANIITVYKGNEVIYNGKKAFVDIESGGTTTTVIIYKQLFPIKILNKIYSDKNIRVE
jgi:hypothetical protein